ncbi:hypothetical protein [Salana multivorans]
MDEIRWDSASDAAAAWGWVRELTGEFGTVGGDVPAGFESYLSIPSSPDPQDRTSSLVPFGHDDDGGSSPTQLARLLEVLGAQGEDVLHCAIWNGFGGMFREAGGGVSGASLLGAVRDPGGGLTAEERAAEHARAIAEWEARLPLRPKATTFELPHREYYTWTTTVERLPADIAWLDRTTPTIAFPSSRRWCWHSEIDSRRTEIGGPADLLAPLLAPQWGGIRVSWEERLWEIPGWPA